MLNHIRQWVMGGRAQPVTYASAQERVARGAAYLDEVDPGWHRRLDNGTLQLADGHACVLGQLHGEFRRGLSRASLFHLGSAPRANLSPVRFGFMCVQGVSEEMTARDYEHLNQAWREELQQRRIAEGALLGDTQPPRRQHKTVPA